MLYRLCTLPDLLYPFARSGATCSTFRPFVVSLREPVANVFIRMQGNWAPKKLLQMIPLEEVILRFFISLLFDPKGVYVNRAVK